jgi:hypothetical protein
VVVTKKAATILDQLNERRFDWAHEVAATLPFDDIKVANEILSAVREKLSD